jgi:predicted ABC-type ATPase
MDKHKPIIMAFAGPNGSGKTTVTQKLPIVGTYVNADDIKKEYEITDMEAAQQAESLRNALINKGMDFSFETVLSTDRNILLLKKAKEHGYELSCRIFCHHTALLVGHIAPAMLPPVTIIL